MKILEQEGTEFVPSRRGKRTGIFIVNNYAAIEWGKARGILQNQNV